MYNVYAFYSRAMFVYFNRLLFKSISLLPLFHFISLLPFFPLLPFLSLLPFSPPLLVRFPSSLPFLSTLPFHTPPFLLTSPFPPISSSLNPPHIFFRYLLSLVASFPSNPLFLSYSSISPTPSFSTPSFFPTPLFHPIPSFHPTPLFRPTTPSSPFLLPIPFISIPPFHHTPIFLPIPPSLPLLLFFISLLYLFATYASSDSFLFSLFFPSFPHFPPLLPFLPLHSFLPYIHVFLPPPFLACLLSFASLCYLLPLLLFLPLLHFHFPSHIPAFLPFLPFFPHLSILLSVPPLYIHRPPSLSSILFLPTGSLPLSLSFSLSLSLPLILQNVIFISPSVPSISSSFLLFTPTPFLSPSLSPLHLFPTSLSPSLPSLCCVLYIAQ